MNDRPNLILPPDAQPEEPQVKPRQPHNCTMCRHFDKNPQLPIRGLCMFFPPSIHVIGMAQGALHGQVVPQTSQFVPTVGIDWVCGQFSPNAEGLQ